MGRNEKGRQPELKTPLLEGNQKLPLYPTESLMALRSINMVYIPSWLSVVRGSLVEPREGPSGTRPASVAHCTQRKVRLQHSKCVGQRIKEVT